MSRFSESCQIQGRLWRPHHYLWCGVLTTLPAIITMGIYQFWSNILFPKNRWSSNFFLSENFWKFLLITNLKGWIRFFWSHEPDVSWKHKDPNWKCCLRIVFNTLWYYYYIARKVNLGLVICLRTQITLDYLYSSRWLSKRHLSA